MFFPERGYGERRHDTLASGRISVAFVSIDSDSIVRQLAVQFVCVFVSCDFGLFLLIGISPMVTRSSVTTPRPAEAIPSLHTSFLNATESWTWLDVVPT